MTIAVLQKGEKMKKQYLLKYIDKNDLLNGIYSENPTDVMSYIANFPTADVVERKTAYLINPNPYGACSECGFLIDIRDKFNYCPNCGARMEKEDV